MAEAVLQEIAALRSVLADGLAKTREEIALLRSSDEVLLGRLTAFEKSVEGRLAALEAGKGSGGGSLEAVAELATINAKAVFDEQEARAKRMREEKRLHCVQCDRDFYESFNAEGECLYHSGTVRPLGSKYKWSCCQVEFRNANDAAYVEGCCRSRHVCEHHTRFRYSAYQKWVDSEIKSGSCEGWDENVRKSFASGAELVVEVGCFQSREADGSHSSPRLYVLSGESRGDKTMVLFTPAELAALASSPTPLPDIFTVPATEANAFSHYAARWIVGDGVIKGVETVVQPVQDSSPSIHRVLFKAEGVTFESVSRVDPPHLRIPMDLSAYAGLLPPPSSSGAHLVDPPPYKVKKGKSEGSSTLRLKPDGDIELSQTMGSGDSFSQIVLMKVVVINPEETAAAVTELRMEYENHHGEWIAVDQVRVSSRDSFEETATNFNIGGSQTLNTSVKGYITIAGKGGSDNFRRSLAHRSLPQPLRVRVTIEDLRGAEASVVAEQYNKPLGLPTLAELEEKVKAKIPLFLAIDSEAELDRFYVTVHRENNRVKVSCPGRYWTFDDGDLYGVRWWKARTLGTESLELLREEVSRRLVTVHLLYDPASDTVFGLRAHLESKAEDAHADGSVLLTAVGPRQGAPVFTFPQLLVAGTEVEAGCTNVNASEGDTLAWYVPGTLDRASVKSKTVRGSDLTEDGCLKASLAVPLPAHPGVYELRYFKAGTNRHPTFISSPLVVI